MSTESLMLDGRREMGGDSDHAELCRARVGTTIDGVGTARELP